MEEWRPSWPRYLAFARVGLVVVVLVVVVGVVAAVVSTKALLALAPLEVVVVGTGTITFGVQALRIHRTRLVIDPDAVTWHGVLSHRQLSRSSLRGRACRLQRPLMRSLPAYMLFATDGHRRIRLVGGLWDEGDLSRIADELEIPSSPDAMTAKAIEEDAPGSTTAFARHPWVTSFGVVAVTLVVVTAVAIILVGSTGTGTGRGPAQVSAATVADQTETLEDIEQAVGRSGWRPARIDLWTCGGVNGHPAGWTRHAEVINDRHRTGLTSTLAKVQTVLKQHHYELLSPHDHSDTAVVSGVRGPDTPGEVVEVQLDRTYASAELTGPCEH